MHKTYRFGDLVEKYIDNRGKTPPLSEDGIPLLEVKHLPVEGKYPSLQTSKHVSQDVYDNWFREHLEAGDILFSTVGTTGRVAITPKNQKVAIAQNVLGLRFKPSLFDPAYAFYYLRAKPFQHEIESRLITTVQASIKRRDMVGIPINLPAMQVQKKIASVLGVLDDKIENNRQMNETLEEMARAIFKSWFVDFDPVHAKAAGNAPAHMDAETAALFPSSFGDDGLPVGWVKATLGDIAQNPKRTVKPDEVDDTTPYIGLEHMPRNSIALGEWGSAGKVSSNKSKFEKGEFLFGKLRPYFHKVGITAVSGICSTDILIVRPKEECWTGTTISCISSVEFVNYTNQNSTGTKMPRTNWKDMSRYDITLPDKKTAHSFNRLMAPMMEKITTNIIENQTLAELRDTLLPKLMSGEIRVKDAESEMEAAV